MAEPGNKYKRPMVSLGVLHIVNGVLLPILWGVSMVWSYYTATNYVAVEIWGSVLFFIPSGILGIIAVTSKSRGVAIASMVMNILGGVAGLVAVIMVAIITGYDTSRYHYAGDIAIDFITLVVALLELVVCIVASVYSGLVIKANPRQMQPTTVIFSNVAYPVNQQLHPGQPVQAQYVGQPGQQYIGQPGQQYVGQPGQYAGQPVQIQFVGPAGGPAPPYQAGQPVQYVGQPAPAAPPPTEEKMAGPPEMMNY